MVVCRRVLLWYYKGWKWFCVSAFVLWRYIDFVYGSIWTVFNGSVSHCLCLGTI